MVPRYVRQLLDEAREIDRLSWSQNKGDRTIALTRACALLTQLAESGTLEDFNRHVSRWSGGNSRAVAQAEFDRFLNAEHDLLARIGLDESLVRELVDSCRRTFLRLPPTRPTDAAWEQVINSLDSLRDETCRAAAAAVAEDARQANLGRVVKLVGWGTRSSGAFLSLDTELQQRLDEMSRLLPDEFILIRVSDLGELLLEEAMDTNSENDEGERARTTETPE